MVRFTNSAGKQEVDTGPRQLTLKPRGLAFRDGTAAGRKNTVQQLAAELKLLGQIARLEDAKALLRGNPDPSLKGAVRAFWLENKGKFDQTDKHEKCQVHGFTWECVPLESVQDLLDHKHITTTQTYDKWRRSVRDSASHKVGDLRSTGTTFANPLASNERKLLIAIEKARRARIF